MLLGGASAQEVPKNAIQAGCDQFTRQSAVFVWDDRALFVGNRSETSAHAHHAVELCIALDSLGIDMWSPDGTDLKGVGGAIVRAGVTHRLAVAGPKVAVLYLDPQLPLAASLDSWLGARDVAELPPALPHSSREAFRGLLETTEVSLEEARRKCAQLLARFAQERERPRLDWRVRQAMRRIEASLDAPPTLQELALDAGISGSRLRHRFREQIGLPISRYVLWMRLRKALVRALEGATMARAAQEAGFADAAHFTRTCRRMFGLPPTAFTPADAVYVAK